MYIKLANFFASYWTTPAAHINEYGLDPESGLPAILPPDSSNNNTVNTVLFRMYSMSIAGKKRVLNGGHYP